MRHDILAHARAVVFDAYGTLFDVHAAVARHADAIGPDAAALSETWRAKQLEYSWVRTLMGAYQDFWSLTEQALDQARAAVAFVEDENTASMAAHTRLGGEPVGRFEHEGRGLTVLTHATTGTGASA